METNSPLSDSKTEEVQNFEAKPTIHPEEKNVEAPPIEPEKKVSLNFSKKSTPAKTKPALKELLLFIVDDDALYLTALEQSISVKLPHIKIKTFLTGEACLQQMRLKPDVVILDYFLDSKVSYAWNGLTILQQIKKLNPKTKVIMLSSQDSLDVAVKCIDNGSFDYISKSESAFVKINNVLTNIIEDVKVNEKGMKPYQIIGIIVIIILLLSYLIIKK